MFDTACWNKSDWRVCGQALARGTNACANGAKESGNARRPRAAVCASFVADDEGTFVTDNNSRRTRRHGCERYAAFLLAPHFIHISGHRCALSAAQPNVAIRHSVGGLVEARIACAGGSRGALRKRG